MKKLAVLFSAILLVLSLLGTTGGCQGQPPTATPAPPNPTQAPARTPVSTPGPPSPMPEPTRTPVYTPALPRETPMPAGTPITTPAPPSTTPTAKPPATPTPVPIVWARPGAPVTLTVDAAANSATYKSGAVDVSGYFYKPSGTGPFPAVLVLHGKSGQPKSPPPEVQWLATQGYVALAPDYFTPIGMTAEKFDVSFYLNNVDQAREVLGQGLEALKSLPYVSPGRIGVVGFSLGGYFAFILASRDDVKCIISYYGAYAPTAPARYRLADIIAQIKAPVLMFHGDKDELVPIANANTARDLLAMSGKQYEYIVYPGAGHTFNAPGGPLANPQATADAQQKVLTFLKTKLQ